MSRQFLPVAAAAVLWAAAGQAAAHADTTPCVVPDTSSAWGAPEGKFWTEINKEIDVLRGIANGSDPMIDAVRDANDQGRNAAIAGAINTVEIRVNCLARNYGGLSGEQQRAVNTGSHVVAVTAAGGLLSSAYPVAQTAFGYAAFTPILINQISALEPKRDLYAGARVGVDRIAERYMALQQSGAAVATIDTAGFSEELRGVCGSVRAVMGKQPTNPAQPGVLVAEAQRLANQCETLQRANVDHQLVQQDLDLLRGDLPRYYAADVLSFHENLQQRHRDMLFTPAETLTAILASPFRAADQLLTGESGKQAEDIIRTQRAFEGLNQQLTPLAQRLTRPQPAVLDPIATPDALRSGGDEDTLTLRDAAVMIDGLRARQRRDRGRVLQLLEAAERTDLKFDYSVTAGAVRITLEKPAPPPATP